MLAHITYLSDKSMRNKFGRKLQKKDKLDFTFDPEYQVESYLRYQGTRFTDRFDANSYLYITKALNYFDLGSEFNSLDEALSKVHAKFLIIAFTSDWLYPPYMSKILVKSLLKSNKECSYAEIQTDFGHDAFLLEFKELTRLSKNFIEDAP